MEATKCDRCGEYYLGIRRKVGLKLGEDTTLNKDLCQVCGEEFLQWVGIK